MNICNIKYIKYIICRRRFGNRSSQRTNVILDSEEETNRSGDIAMCDENENVSGDYMFKRYSQDAIRKSNLSINSCVSIGSTMSSYGRKKRRAPQPPRRSENIETNEVNQIFYLNSFLLNLSIFIISLFQTVHEASNIKLQIVEPTDITRVTENIDDLTKKSKNLDQEVNKEKENSILSSNDISSKKTEDNLTKIIETNANIEKTSIEKKLVDMEQLESKISVIEDYKESEKDFEQSKKEEEDIQVEYCRTSEKNIEIIKDVDQTNSLELDDISLRRKSSSSTLSRNDSFSVKDEIEKIERQIKALETKNASKNCSEEKNIRNSIQENRRHFFQNMVETDNDKDPIKIEFKEFPKEQKDIHVVRLNDSPIPVIAPREPVKVIELHISEPIRRKPEILEDVNPIPKPRRHSALNLNLNDSQSNMTLNNKNFEPIRGKSL